MDIQAALDELIHLAEQIGVDIRREALGGEGGGLCVLRGRRVLFIDTYADLQTRYDKTLAALAGLPEIEAHYIRPDLRDALERARREAGA